MKKQSISLTVTLITIGILTFLVVHYAADYYLDNSVESPKQTSYSDCKTTNQEHKVVLNHDGAKPFSTKASLCDTLTITNTDSQLRQIAFGEHPNHQAYAGVSETPLSKNQSLTIKLQKTGTYKFHDHLQPNVHGTFTVSP